jgi:hypothetical protein
MAFHVKDQVTDEAVHSLARIKRKSLTETIREVVEHEYERECSRPAARTPAPYPAAVRCHFSPRRIAGRQGVLRRVVLRSLMFLDASAIIAMLAGESDAARLAARLGQDSR